MIGRKAVVNHLALINTMKQFILSGFLILIGLVQSNAQQSKVHINHTAIYVVDIQKTAKQKLIAENEKERLSLLKEKKEQQKLVDSIKKDKNKIRG